RGCATSPRTTPAGRRRSRTSRRARRGVCSSGARGTAASFAPWAPRARVRDARGRSAGRVATLDEERDLGGVVGEPDRGVVGGSRLVVAAVSAQQVGAGGVERVVAVESVPQRLDRGEGDLRSVHLG